MLQCISLDNYVYNILAGIFIGKNFKVVSVVLEIREKAKGGLGCFAPLKHEAKIGVRPQTK